MAILYLMTIMTKNRRILTSYCCDVLRSFADFYGVSIDYILCFSDDKSRQRRNIRHNCQKFIDLVRKYSHITELTPQILNEFIDKVTVHQAVKVDGKRRQDIDVYFNGVGQMLPPRQISPDEEKKPETTE